MKNFTLIFILSQLFYLCANFPSLNMPQNFDSKNQEIKNPLSVIIKIKLQQQVILYVM
jgi:hypothetical protein